tara:strand:+ start:524 stop:1180 length:657 start_codon:yes stop_codon:yes gene_type:complete
MGAIQTKNLNAFKTSLRGGGARPNIFEVSIPSFPANVQTQVKWTEGKLNDDLRFLCKAAQLPASTIAEIPVPFRGRILKVAGDRTFEPWTITIINDEDFQLRSAFEGWMNQINDISHATGLTNPSSYMTNAYVSQLGRGLTKESIVQPINGDNGQSKQQVLRSYKFQDIFPTEVSAIDLSYDSTDTIEEFTVTFQVQDVRPGKNEEGRNDGPGTPFIK